MFSNKLHVFFGGSVGVGKTSVIDALFGTFDSNAVWWIREYIDKDLENGVNNLTANLEGRMDDLSFQRYILGCTKLQVFNDYYAKAKVILWERHPMESLLFMGLSVKQGRCSTSDYHIFEEELKKFCKDFKIPPLVKTAAIYKTLPIDTHDMEPHMISFIVKEKICNSLWSMECLPIYVFLYCSNNFDQFERIHKRGRACEVSLYTDVSVVEKLNQQYYDFICERVPKLLKWKEYGLFSIN